ncbi:hypothetical protein CARUB_v10021240mg [Capsella rubella]|uniref:Uncharacterized protein n=1 Tax=Capsella rubella TaxID=81985 RepID=R0GJC3_9BRAS|nr:hypothetical protein CARUB_v10021240mg [Capsella rubella]
MGLNLSSNALLLSLFLLILCLFSEIGGIETTHQRLVEEPPIELAASPSCSCGASAGSAPPIQQQRPCPRPRPCPPPRAR